MMPEGPYDANRLERSIHIWALDTGSPETVAGRFLPVLSADESSRADRFRFTKLRDSFVLTRGVLRYLLGRYLSALPASLRFSYGPKGKPALADNSRIHFNLSHSGEMAVIALTYDCAIGVDIEQLRPMTDMQEIAERFFCPEEAAEILSVPAPGREEAFFRCWTRKEAYIKAVGVGLSVPLESFRVTVRPNLPASLIHIGRDTDATEGWILRDLSLRKGYEAAVAYAGRERELSVSAIEDPVRFFRL
jgi:4'-phosphopantetheinyl transferase